MEYRGKGYTIVQGVGPNSWMWRVQLDEKTARSGEAPTRATAMNSIVWLVDKALAPKKVKLKTPSDQEPNSTDPGT
jgi:hypothetical protein